MKKPGTTIKAVHEYLKDNYGEENIPGKYNSLKSYTEYSHDKAPGVLARAPFELQREHHLAQTKIASFRKKARFIAPKGHVLLILIFEAVSIV